MPSGPLGRRARQRGWRRELRTVRRTIWGCVVALTSLAACTGVLLAFRPHLAVATSALVLVVPVVLAVAVGGFAVGLGTAVAGFLVFDWFFIPPFGTLSVGAAQNWVALGVYLVVVLVVARVVAVQQAARAVAAAREDAVRRLFDVTESLIGERPLAELLDLVATTVHEAFATRWVAVLLPSDGVLEIAATAGAPLDDDDRRAALGPVGSTQSMALAGHPGDVSRLALLALQRPVGQLVLAGAELDEFRRQLLSTIANQAALAIERSQLRAQALRTELLEEVDRSRSALVGAVSHDLRTPLATITAAVTTLRDREATLSPGDHDELLATIEDQSERLARLVTNLLDMARLEAGSLVLRPEPHAVRELVDAALAASTAALREHLVRVDLDDELPLVEVDEVLIVQVVANLLHNAAQHSPDDSAITVTAHVAGTDVVVTVRDQGPGVPEAEREQIFHMLDRNAGSGRAGLGLAISTAFVGAHGGRLRVEDAPGGGASFSFSLPVADLDQVPS
jgi:two-component system sensor histidine kinase KdpD